MAGRRRPRVMHPPNALQLATDGARPPAREIEVDPVDEASRESFPSSDPPASGGACALAESAETV